MSFILFSAIAAAQNPLVCTPFNLSGCTGTGTFSLSRNTLAFAATSNGSVVTLAQNVTVSATAGVSAWSASSDSTWLRVTPGTGQPGGAFSVSIVSGAFSSAGTYTGKITVNATGASNGPLFVNCTLTVTSSGAGGAQIVKVSGDGQLTTLFNGFTLPLVVRVKDAAGLPIAGKTVTWTRSGDVNFGSPASTTTDANGLAQITAIPAGYFNPGTPFLVYSITATADVGAATFTMTSYPVTGVTNYNPPPLITLVKPAQDNRTITAKLGSTTVDAVRAQVVSGGGNATNPTVIPGVALNVSTSNTDPTLGVVAHCQGGTPLSGADGVVSCNLIVEGRVGSAPLLVNIGALRDFPGVQLTVTPGDPVAPGNPFGSFDTPVDNATGVSGSISVTGWALDDIGVKQVTIWRDPFGPESVQPNGYVYIGDSLFVPGARPDVEAAFPAYPRAYRAGWGYMLLTNTLPGNGNGIFKLHAIASDEEGNQVNLGARTIAVDNVHSVRPFGALDTPAPGETISGIFTNSGWALTPPPAFIANSGSTIWVNIDGVDLAHPLFGSYRPDIASIFPGYANSYTSAGAHYLDTTRYSNAMHAIVWNVYDNQGHSGGIGSRYFNIQNRATAAIAEPAPVAAEVVEAERTFQLRTARLQRPTTWVTSYPAFRQGYDRNAALTPIRQAGEGLLEPIELKELDKLELHLAGGQQWTAALRVGDELRELPIGSTFDAEGGIFYWQLGPGFLGEFTLEFQAADGATIPVLVRVGAPGPVR